MSSVFFLIELRIFEQKLALELSRISTQASPAMPPVFAPREHLYEGWLICPRAHAVVRNFRIPAFSNEVMDKLTTEGWPLYDQLHRAHGGDDPVFAIGDIQ